MKLDTARARTARLATLAALPLLLAGCGGADAEEGGPGGPREDAPVPAVEAVRARLGALPLRERFTGTVRAAGQVVIYPQTSGVLVEVLAQNGDRVEAGQPLARIRAQTSQTQLAQARANLGVARAELRQAEASLAEMEAQFERTRLLAEDRLVSAETVETQRAQLEAARAAAARARARVGAEQAAVEEREEALRQTVVRAPIAGRVGQRTAEVGMRVDGQTPLFTVGRLESLRVEVPVTQDILPRIRPGQRVELRAEGFGGPAIEAEVSRISPFLQEGSYSAEVEIDVPNRNGALLPGMFVTVDVFYGESERATLIPVSALYEDPATGLEGVYAAPELPAVRSAARAGEDAGGADGGEALTPPARFRFQPVEVLAEGDQTVGVSGLAPETWVVVIGQHLLSERGGDEPPQARVRPVGWERVLGLQRLQRQDLLRQFMEKQQRIARQRAGGSDPAAAAPPATM